MPFGNLRLYMKALLHFGSQVETAKRQETAKKQKGKNK
jgi:hypothetical protein